MVRLRGLGGITVGLLTVLATTSCLAQAPTLGNELPQAGNYPGTSASLLGPIPGSGGATYSDPAVGGGQILGGRPGASTPRVPTSISDPGNQAGTPLIPGAQALPAAQPLTAVPLYGSLDLPTVDDEGPADGLTYDDALARLLEFNPELAARRIEIPMARADVVTASLRANPIFYSDAQLVPYGEYTKKSPGGQTQYDVNISHPLDLSHKRKQRTRVATQALRAVEVQYLDAVRIQIGNMGNAYVDALAARETLRYVEAGQKGLDSVLEATQGLAARGSRTSADVGRILAQRQSARVGVIEATERYRRARATLGGYLALAPAESEPLELRAALQPPEPVVPPEEQLASLALSCRPDVVAARIGVAYATAGLDLQRANRFADAYLLFQPYTFQNNSPVGLKSATSYAFGITVPLPIYNRNQGNIERARLNIRQTELQLDALSRQVILEVRQAAREYEQSKLDLEILGREVVPVSKKARDDTLNLFKAGEIVDVTVLLNVQREYNDIVRQYRDTAVRHRRSMLGLNTAVGSRVLP